jgi:hypothetical protein
MKISLSFSLFYTTFLLPTISSVTTAQTCAPEPLEYTDEVGMMVEKVGNVPTNTTDAWTYNMMVSDTLRKQDMVFFLDQFKGKIYCHSGNAGDEVMKIWDMSEDEIPAGLDLSNASFGAAQQFKVHAMTQGAYKNQVIVVFSSQTLPAGWTEPDAPLPAAGKYSGYACDRDGETPVFVRDIYRMGTLPDCSMSGAGVESIPIYNVFYKFKLDEGKLTNPRPFFVLENQLLPGHLGGGIETLDNGNILWSTGDCLLFGFDGRYAPQDDKESCGKILMINPKRQGAYSVVAKGVRNSQQMKIERSGGKDRKKDHLVFMDIGGVTAEEVNKIRLHKLVGGGKNKKKKITNFGWGRNADGKTREGTFYVAPGSGGNLGGQPPCEENASVPEVGFHQPWIQFGRTATDFYYAISSFVCSNKKSFNKLKLVWTEFNTGAVLGTMTGSSQANGPSKGYKIKLYNTDNVEYEGAFNDLVKEELGEVGYYRGDPRLFHYPDGTAGVFIERTGAFYKLTEIEI